MDKKRLDNLIRRMKNGDESAFAELYEITQNSVFAFLITMCKNKEVAEDLMQDTYIKVRQNVQKYQNGTNAFAWIIQIAKNHAYNELKKAKREQATDFTEFDIVSDISVEQQADSYIFDTVIKTLNQQEAQIILLHIIGGFKHRETAEILELPLGTVLWSYRNSLKKVKIKLKEDNNEL